MNYIVIYNNLVYSMAVLILLSTLINSTKSRYITAFVISMAAGLLLTNNASFIMPVVLIVLTVCFTKNRKEYRRIFYKCLTAVTICFFIISTICSLALLIAPKQLYSDGYNLFVGGALLASSIAVKAKSSIMDWCRELENYEYAIALELIVLIFFSFILPKYCPVIAAENTGQWGVFILAFMFVLLTVGLLISRMNSLEHSRRELASQIEQRKSYAENINSQFEKIITLKHYYNKLYQSIVPFIRDKDMDGLQQYYERYVTPIHKDFIQNRQQLSGIKNEIILNLIEITTGQTATIDGLTLDIDVLGEIKLADNIALDIFELLSNFIDNAVRELSKQDYGLLRISLRNVDGQISVQIANTSEKSIEIDSLYSHKQRDGHGYGLKRVREIIFRQPCIKHFTYKDGMFEGKEIFVQQIVITQERG